MGVEKNIILWKKWRKRVMNGESEGTKRVMSGWSPRKRDCILDGVETGE